MKSQSIPSSNTNSVKRWLLIVLGLLILFAVGAVVVYSMNEGRVIALLPYIIICAVILFFVTLFGAFQVRKSFASAPVIALGTWVVLGIVGAVGGAYLFQNNLPPRYQQELSEQLPFLRSLMAPTPSGGIVPTVDPSASQLSAEDLLSMPIIGGSESTSEPETSQEAGVPTLEPDEGAFYNTRIHLRIPPSTSNHADQEKTAPVLFAQDPTSTPVQPRPQLPVSARLNGIQHIQQGWNNCGPANITMALSYFGWSRSQDYAANLLKPNTEDKNVSPGELVRFVNTYTDQRAITRMGGDLYLLRNLLAHNFPVIIETGYYLEGTDWLGHYQTLIGYDEMASAFYLYDSNLGSGENGTGIATSYVDLDREWQAFNRLFIVLYEPEREGELTGILGEYASVNRAYEIALETATNEARANRQNPYAWFNMGTSYTRLGQHEEAASAYDQARMLGLPFRMLWYQFGPFEAYFEAGRYSDVESLVQNNLTNGAQYVEETFFWQGQVLAAQGSVSEAAAAYRRALNFNPNYIAAQEALDNL